MSPDRTFLCPESMQPHVVRVLKGEYDVPVEFDEPPRIVDIGANVGAFAIWADRRWPGARITCYEPMPETYAMLWRNVGQWGKADCRMAACVGYGRGPMAILYEGGPNCGCASLKDLGEQRTDRPVMVPAVVMNDSADVIKIDAEGSELDILGATLAELKNRPPTLLLLEAHGQADKDAIGQLLTDWTCIKSTQTMPNRWTMGFHKDKP